MKYLLSFIILFAVVSDATDGNEAYRQGEYSKAEEFYRQAINEEPNNAQLIFNLANALAQTKDDGIIAACGNAADIKLNTTVIPFIFRGVKLWGINSVTASITRREFVWNEVSKIINFELLEKSIKTIGLEELIETYSKMLKGETSGRYIVDVNK